MDFLVLKYFIPGIVNRLLIERRQPWVKVSGKLSKCDFVIKAPINCGFDTLPYGWDIKKRCSRHMDKRCSWGGMKLIYLAGTGALCLQRWCMEKAEALWGNMMAVEMSIWRQMLDDDHTCNSALWSQFLLSTYTLVVPSNFLGPEGSYKLVQSETRHNYNWRLHIWTIITTLFIC